MSWKLIGKPTTYQLNKKLAAEFATMESAPGDRPLRESRLAVYERMVRADQFGPMTWARARCKQTNCTYRVNGKHTSTLFSGMESLPPLYVTIHSYECDTLDDVAHLYSTFDSGMQVRNAQDIAMSFAGAVPELAQLSRRAICRAVAGLAYKEWLDASAQKRPQERAELLLEYPEFVVWSSDFLSCEAAKHLDRGPVVGAMLTTYLKAQAKSIEFWTAVRDETGESPELPDRRLARWLSRISLSRVGNKLASEMATRKEMYVRSLHAWNAWRKGTTSDLRYFASAKVPSAI